MQANTLDDVITYLDNIIQTSIKQSSRTGYFACLYKKMTLAVITGIKQGYFEDGARMERLDVTFANRYLAAFSAYTSGQPATQAWEAAFKAAETDKCTVIQHLLGGMNAHINLDLGIAAAQTAAGTDITALQNDFDKINLLIGNLINNVQNDLEQICFPMRLLRYVNNKDEEAVINFSIGIARKTAWCNAGLLWAMDASAQQHYIQKMDQEITVIARRVLSPPGFFLNLGLRIIKMFESSEPSRIIGYLSN